MIVRDSTTADARARSFVATWNEPHDDPQRV